MFPRFATNFCQNKIVEFSSKFLLKFRQTGVEATKSLTKLQRFFHDHVCVEKGVTKWIARKNATKSSTESPLTYTS